MPSVPTDIQRHPERDKGSTLQGKNGTGPSATIPLGHHATDLLRALPTQFHAAQSQEAVPQVLRRRP